MSHPKQTKIAGVSYTLEKIGKKLTLKKTSINKTLMKNKDTIFRLIGLALILYALYLACN